MLDLEFLTFSFGSNFTVSLQLFVTSNIAKFHVNLSISISVFCTFLSNILTITNPEISSTNGASIFINFCSFAKNGINLFKKLKT